MIEEPEPCEEWPLENVEAVGEYKLADEEEDRLAGADVSAEDIEGASIVGRWQ